MWSLLPQSHFKVRAVIDRVQSSLVDLRKCYEWDSKDPSKPNYDGLPLCEKYAITELFGLHALGVALFEKKLALVHHPPPENEDELCWMSDAKFGLQRLQGPNLFHLKRFPNCNDLYFIDYSFLAQYKLFKDMQSSVALEPQCVLKRVAEALEPTSIQLSSDFQANKETSLPWKWNYAKLVLQTCDFFHTQTITHFAHCHLTMEIFIMATMQVWAPNDLMYKLLKPHFTKTLAVNHYGRTVLMPWFIKHCSLVEETHVQTEFKEEDLDLDLIANNQFPKQCYGRKDALHILHALKRFIHSVICENDKVELHWEQVNEWSAKIREKLPWFSIRDKPELARVVGCIIFHATVRHASANDSQHVYFANAMDAPCRLSKPIPADCATTNIWTDKDWKRYCFESLPSLELCQFQNELVKVISEQGFANDSLLESIEAYANFAPPLTLQRLRSRLRQISLNIQTRKTYPWLDPMRVNASTST